MTPAPPSVHAVRAAWRISILSVGWALASSASSIAIGVSSGLVVLLAAGAMAGVDAIGSLALIVHFGHGRRHAALPPTFERRAHLTVLAGLFVVGCAAAVVGAVRLRANEHPAELHLGAVTLALVSVVVLSTFSWRKRLIARRLASPALRSDGHVSGIGAAQAVVALAGIVAAESVGWWWADAVATTVVGAGAVALAVMTWRRESAPRQRSTHRGMPLAVALAGTLAATAMAAVPDLG